MTSHDPHPDQARPAGQPPPATGDASRHPARSWPLTRKTLVTRAVALAVAGLAIYLVLPSLTRVLASWPRLLTLDQIWLVVALAAEVASFTCTFALQRLALQTHEWFSVVTAGLSGNAVSGILPGGAAAGAGLQFEMLSNAGFDTDAAAAALTAFSLLEVGALLALPAVAVPWVLAGTAVSPGLVHTALLGLGMFCLLAIVGTVLLKTDRPLAAIGRAAAKPDHPRPPPAANRPGHAAAVRTRQDQVGHRPQLVAGPPAHRRPARVRFRLPASCPARHRHSPPACPGPAGLRGRQRH